MAFLNQSKKSKESLGGRVGIRDYLVQTLIALLDGLRSGHQFLRVTLEPDHRWEKADSHVVGYATSCLGALGGFIS
jgi:hypothetical protein